MKEDNVPSYFESSNYNDASIANLYPAFMQASPPLFT